MTESTRADSQPPQVPMIKAEDVLGFFFILGEEMQQIPASYRDAVFKKLDKRAIASGGPNSVTSLVTKAFKDGWMNYPT